MYPFLPSKYLSNVAPLQAIQWSGMHSNESLVCFQYLPSNFLDRESFLPPNTDTLFGISGDNIAGFGPDSDSNRWIRKSYGSLQFHSGNISAGKQSGSTVKG